MPFFCSFIITCYSLVDHRMTSREEAGETRSCSQTTQTKRAEQVRNNVDISGHAAHIHQDVEPNQQEQSCATSTHLHKQMYRVEWWR